MLHPAPILSLWDSSGFSRYKTRTIANSDAAGYVYVNGAIDAADRAVSEPLG